MGHRLRFFGFLKVCLRVPGLLLQFRKFGVQGLKPSFGFFLTARQFLGASREFL